MKMKIGTFLIAAAVMVSAESYQQRLSDSTTVLHEMSQASDQGIPQDLLRKARCVIAELIAEDERGRMVYRRGYLAGNPAQTVKLRIFPTGAAGAGFFKTDKP